MRHSVPREPIIKVIRDHMITHPDESYEELSISLGMNKSYIRAMFVGARYSRDGKKVLKKYETMDFDTADKILCKLNKYDLWYEAPLNQYYWPDGVIPPDLSKPVKCVNPQCDGWFSLPTETVGNEGAWSRKYCSNRCKNQHIKARLKTRPGSVKKALRTARKWESDNAEYRREQKRQWRLANKEKMAKYKRDYRRRKKENDETEARSGSAEKTSSKTTTRKRQEDVGKSKASSSRATTRKADR